MNNRIVLIATFRSGQRAITGISVTYDFAPGKVQLAYLRGHLTDPAAAWGRAARLRSIEEILTQFERHLERELTPQEKRLLRLSYAAYPESRADDDDETETRVAQAGD